MSWSLNGTLKVEGQEWQISITDNSTTIYESDVRNITTLMRFLFHIDNKELFYRNKRGQIKRLFGKESG